MSLPGKAGDAFARHGRFASVTTGWHGAPFGIRILGYFIGAVDGSSVPSGRRLRT
jgi:hypothetical protein